MIQLRDYQQEAVSRVLTAYERDPSGRELIVVATGGGKTIIFSSIIHSLQGSHGVNALIVAHRDELLDQAADKFRFFQPDAVIGKIGGGVAQYGAPVTVASVATISRPKHLKALRALYGAGRGLVIVVDEAHHVAASGYQGVLEAFPEAFVLMVTATPKRLDGKEILDKPAIFTRSIAQMVREGHLCDIRAIAVRTEVSLDEIKSLAGDFNQQQLDNAVNTPERNRRVVHAYQQHTPGRRAVAFCVTIDHAQALAYAFNDAGIDARVITGDTPMEERHRLYAAFRAGEVLVLCNVMVLTEGWDEPRAEVAIMARPTQSQSLFIQCVGRVLRLAPGKEKAIVLDITDNSLRLRIAPQSLKKAVGVQMHDGESLLEAEQREEDERAEREAAEKRALIRKLNDRRNRDIAVDLLGLPEWTERPDGKFVLTVGVDHHRIALVPRASADWTPLYDVYARLAPSYEPAQKWASGLPLDQACQYAEKQAHLLLEKGATLVDQTASWRSKPIDPDSKQARMLARFNIAWGEGTEILTKGQATNAIDAHMREIEQKKAVKAARKAAREAVRQERMEA